MPMDDKKLKKQYKLIRKYLCEDLDGEACAELKKTLSDCREVRIYYDTMRKTVVLCKECECSETLPEETKERLFDCLGLGEFKDINNEIRKRNEQ